MRRWWGIGAASVVSAAIVLHALTCVGTRLADLSQRWEMLVAGSTVVGPLPASDTRAADDSRSWDCDISPHILRFGWLVSEVRDHG